MSQPNLNEDLNIVANSNLEITLLDGDLNIIQALDDEPNDVGGLTSAELKAKFDEGPNKIKEYINGTLIPEILTEEATEAARAAAEAQRETNENQRIENENARIAAEQARVDETSGVVAQANQAAQSWAVGGTGTREGEDTNNAKYWSDKAREAAGGDFVPTSEKGAANGVATLGADALLAAAQRPKAGGLYRDDGKTTLEKSLTEISTTLQKKADLGADGKVLAEQLPKIPTAVLNVTTNAGVVVTATKGSKVLSATADSSGLAVLYPDELGTWTLKVTINGKTLEVPFVIDAITVFNTSLTTDLEAASWGLISAVAEAGNAASAWSVGATKTIKLNGVSYTAQIIGFNHDTKTAGGKAGITFQLVDCLNTTYQMNSSNTNVGGWKSSAMRSRMSEFLGQLDEDLQSVIKPVNKLVSVGNNTSTIETVSDKLFLLSEVEINGSVIFTFAGEGSQYEWYKAGNTKVKKVNGSASNWWGRSPLNGYSTLFACVASNGSIDNNRADNSNGVAFAFCV